MNDLKGSGLTVEEVIALLQKQNPKAIVIVPAGDGTIVPANKVKNTYAYRYTNKETYGGSPYLESEETSKSSVESVIIE